MDQRSRFLFRPEYQWPKDKETAPFFTVPAWWRRFIFRILRPRDITVYHYYLSVMNPVGTAFPTVEQIASDLGIADRDSVRKAIARLVECGFLLKPDQQQRSEHAMGKRSVYQRPCPQYTLWRLLEVGEIDGELFPAKFDRQRHEQHDKSSEPVVRAGLRTLLGHMYAAYEEARRYDDGHREDRTREVLRALLEEQLEAMRSSVQSVIVASEEKLKPLNPKALESVSDRVKQLFAIPINETAPRVPPKPRLGRKKSVAIKKRGAR